MAFLSNGAEWIQARMTYIPLETARFLGDISGLDVLDVGCGDMTADMGLLSLGPKHICSIDLHAPEGASPVEEAAATISNAGFTLPGEYASRLSYTPYDGRTFPFPDNCFDLVFSWAVLEHVQDVPAVLREMRRVAKPGGRILDRKSTRLNSSHRCISYAVFCLIKSITTAEKGLLSHIDNAVFHLDLALHQ